MGRTELDPLPQLSQELQVLKFPILRQSTLKQEEVAARLDQLLLHSNFLGVSIYFLQKTIFSNLDHFLKLAQNHKGALCNRILSDFYFKPKIRKQLPVIITLFMSSKYSIFNKLWGQNSVYNSILVKS